MTDIYECSLRSGKKDLVSSNKMLLWYGDRPSSYAGILSKGFQHKSRTLYRGQPAFSLSDSVIKALSFCYLERGDPQGFLLGCEVDLEDIKEVETHKDLENNNDLKR